MSNHFLVVIKILMKGASLEDIESLKTLSQFNLDTPQSKDKESENSLFKILGKRTV